MRHIIITGTLQNFSDKNIYAHLTSSDSLYVCTMDSCLPSCLDCCMVCNAYRAQKFSPSPPIPFLLRNTDCCGFISKFRMHHQLTQASHPDLKQPTLLSMAVYINEHKDRVQPECKAGGSEKKKNHLFQFSTLTVIP